MNTPPTEFNVSHDGTDPRYRYTAEERDQAASAGHPFELEYGGRKYQGKAILTADDRVVMLADSGAIGVVPMTPEGAAKMRTYLEARAADTCTGVTAAVFGDAMKVHRGDRIAVPGGLAADGGARLFSGEFGDGEVRCLTHPSQECEGEMPTCRAVADGGPAPADMRTPLIDPADLAGRPFTITPIHPGAAEVDNVRRAQASARAHEVADQLRVLLAAPQGMGDTIREAADLIDSLAWCASLADQEPTELGQAFARGQRFEPLELESPVETSLAVIYDNEDIAHEVGKIYVYDGAAVIHVVEPSAVKYLQGGGAVELSRDREFAGNPYRPFVDGDGNPVSVLAELEALSTWEGSTDRLEALVARLAKAVTYSHRVLEKRTVPGSETITLGAHSLTRPSADLAKVHAEADELRMALRSVVRRVQQLRGMDCGTASKAVADAVHAVERTGLPYIEQGDVAHDAAHAAHLQGAGRHFDIGDDGKMVQRRDDGRDSQPNGLVIPDSLTTEERLRAANGRIAAEISRLRASSTDAGVQILRVDNEEYSVPDDVAENFRDAENFGDTRVAVCLRAIESQRARIHVLQDGIDRAMKEIGHSATSDSGDEHSKSIDTAEKILREVR